MVEVFTRRLLSMTEGDVLLAVDFCDSEAINFTIMDKSGNKVGLDLQGFEALKLLIQEYETKYKEAEA